jgi:hypothetical protein
MRSTLIGVFDDRRAAERARDELLRAGFADDEVDLRTGTEDRAWRDGDGRLRVADGRAYDDETRASVGETVAAWFRSLFGFDDDQDVGIYTEAVRRGESVVTVDAADGDRVDRATDILEDCGSVDIDAMANEWQLQGWTRPVDSGNATRAPAPTRTAPLGSTAGSADAMGAAASRNAGDEAQPGDSRAIPEEHVRVDKRVVGRRRMRVYTRTDDGTTPPERRH